MTYEKEKCLLSFDLSTITCGYSIFSFEEKKLKKLDYFKFTKKELWERAIELEAFVDKLLSEYNIIMFAIEERLKSFRAGGTNAEAMLKTATMNFFCQVYFRKKGIDVKEIHVSTARKLAIPMFHSIARKIAGKKQKEIAFDFIVKELGAEIFPKKVMKAGKRKGEEVFLEEASDMSDSYILGKSALIIYPFEK